MNADFLGGKNLITYILIVYFMEMTRKEYLKSLERVMERGKQDGFARIGIQQFSRAYIAGYEMGFRQREGIVEQEWND
ncbi:hypothetical protein HNV12_02510 [Methanococcoides sp. SA1]|nr:hypothetical protein [Methanococcoides sp. SA1]